MQFNKKLNQIVEKNDSLLCVGLDIDHDKIPSHLFKENNTPYFKFLTSIIDATSDLVCAYKLNLAFYEALGTQGFEILKKTIDHIPKNIIVILDGKRNDIGNTAKKYAQSLFDTYLADAVTLNPYLGIDSIQPFLNYHDKCCFILCRTSNPSARDFQDLKIAETPLYITVAQKIKEWNTHNNCGAVVGATYPDELRQIRGILGEETPLLIPGIGKQGGNVKKTVTFGTNQNGSMAIINSSRGILYADASEKFAESARNSALQLRDEINKYRK